MQIVIKVSKDGRIPIPNNLIELELSINEVSMVDEVSFIVRKKGIGYDIITTHADVLRSAQSHFLKEHLN